MEMQRRCNSQAALKRIKLEDLYYLILRFNYKLTVTRAVCYQCQMRHRSTVQDRQYIRRSPPFFFLSIGIHKCTWIIHQEKESPSQLYWTFYSQNYSFQCVREKPKFQILFMKLKRKEMLLICDPVQLVWLQSNRIATLPNLGEQ